jgi:hypothetical protein
LAEPGQPPWTVALILESRYDYALELGPQVVDDGVDHRLQSLERKADEGGRTGAGGYGGTMAHPLLIQ